MCFKWRRRLENISSDIQNHGANKADARAQSQRSATKDAEGERRGLNWSVSQVLPQ